MRFMATRPGHRGFTIRSRIACLIRRKGIRSRLIPGQPALAPLSVQCHFRRMSDDAKTSTMVAELLDATRRGDAAAYDRLLPLLYNELRAIAGRHMRGERPDHTLQPTAL